MNDRIIAEEVNHTVSSDVDLPANRFWVRDEHGNDAQIRLEPNGKIYMCYTADRRRTIQSCELTWSEFIIRFRPFVDLMADQKSTAGF